jgi:hypothetical protein
VIDVRGGVLNDHSGNYDDLVRSLAARSAPPAATAPKPSAAGVPSVASAPAAPAAVAPESKQERIAARGREKQRAKETLRTRKRLLAVEGEIAQLETALAELGWRLGDPQVHRDGDAVRALEAERAETRGRIDGLYREWEGLASDLE